MSPETKRRWLLPLEWTLWAIGLACLAWYGFVAVEAWSYQRTERAAIERMLAVRRLPDSTADRLPPAPASVRLGDPIGILDVPRLGLSVAVINGDDDDTLRVAVGHLPETPMPWDGGNSALAAHRDTFFRPLRDIRDEDEIRLTTARGAFDYRVTGTEIVEPDDVSVLAPTSAKSLTLVTCYPFVYVGAAPRRFIIHAK